jgi:hypothetical protein
VRLGEAKTAVCASCALKRGPEDQQGAELVAHPSFPEFQRLAIQLWREGQTGKKGDGLEVFAILSSKMKVTGAVLPTSLAPRCSPGPTFILDL